MSRKFSQITKEEQDIIENAWLGVDVPYKNLVNILDEIPEVYKDEPHLFLTYLLSRPENMAVFCKYVLNIDIFPFQSVILEQMWKKKFFQLIMSRGGSKSFTLALYAVLRSIFSPGIKTILVSSSFRQSKNLFEYIERIYNGSPLLRSMFSNSGPRRDTDLWRFHIGDSTITAVPASEKTRGLRSNILVCEEFASINIDLFETVFAGFGSVSADPVNNVMKSYAEEKAREMGIVMDDDTEYSDANQMVLISSAYYSWNHLCKYHSKWHDFITARDDRVELTKKYGEIPDGFKSSDYGIIRIPYNLLPSRMMDEAQVFRSKASLIPSVFRNEFEATFADDSDGFFKRSLIENATCAPGRIYVGGSELYFEPLLQGDKDKFYVMGLDPASESDNLAISILELQEDGSRRLVYSWATNKKQHRERVKEGAQEHDYFSYISRKIRDLMDRFNIIRIMMDSQGGGYAVMESLRNKANMKDGEQLVLPVKNDDPRKYNDDDMLEGLHIVELVSFASANWTSQANHGLKKDIEEQRILFPYLDAVVLAIAIAEQGMQECLFDTLPNIMEDIELLKDELSTITVTVTPGGREHFSTPEEVVNGKKGRQKKDRYSALLMANMGARIIQNSSPIQMEPSVGGFASPNGQKSTNMYYGNEEFSKAASLAYSIYD